MDGSENEERSKQHVQSQAGRTLDTFPSNSESLTPAQTTSITVFDPLKEPDKLLIQPDTMHDNSQSLPSFKEETVADDNNSTFTKPLVQFNKDSSNLAHVSSLRSEYSEKFEQSPAITEIRSNGALVKSILAEFEKKTDDNKAYNKDTDISPSEENYMTMTPRRSVLGPRSNTFSSDATVIFNELEENPYVEMTQNIALTSLGETPPKNDPSEHQSYEMVCFSNGKFEPVYMELKQPDQSLSNSELPDILITPKQNTNKSDSSDADDEASKDLDSLETPSQPRFSLSDNFRPASYYLGAIPSVPECQDSSDSELVSPPPIPVSPPPLDDLENTDDSIVINQDDNTGKKDHLFIKYNYHPNRNSDQYFNSVPRLTKLRNKNFKDQDGLSTCSAENDRRISSRLSQQSDSDIELRTPLSRNLEYERRLKRRPVSEEFCSELDSMDGHFNDSVDLDKYLTDLQISTLSEVDDDNNNQQNDSFLNEQFHEYENLYLTGYVSKSGQKVDKSRNQSCSQNTANESILSNDDYTHRGRPDSSTSASAEISSLLQGSNRSTPTIRVSSSLSVQEIPTTSSYFSDRRDKSSNSSFNQPAPYYYSDLSMNTSNTDNTTMLTLNNQRGAMNGSKRDITHIINPLKSSHLRNGIRMSTRESANTFKLAAEARSVSVDFLNLADKSGHIDKKNIYESDTLKRLKVVETNQTQSDPETRNLYPFRKTDKFHVDTTPNDSNVRRSHSLEGLLENVLSESAEETETVTSQNCVSDALAEGSYLWEEDSIWRERLRSASQRHTKSMDDLDSIRNTKVKKSPRGITREVTYVNDNIYNVPVHNRNENGNKNEMRKEGSFVIDREKLRQWDLMSSAPSDDQLSAMAALQGPRGNNTVVETGDGSAWEQIEVTDTQQPGTHLFHHCFY